MIRKLKISHFLCLINIHNWIYYNEKTRVRVCKNCLKKEYLTSKRKMVRKADISDIRLIRISKIFNKKTD